MEEAQENTKMLTVDKEVKDIFKEEEKHQVLKEKNVRMEKTSFSAFSVYWKINCEDCGKTFKNLEIQEKHIKEEYDINSIETYLRR